MTASCSANLVFPAPEVPTMRRRVQWAGNGSLKLNARTGSAYSS